MSRSIVSKTKPGSAAGMGISPSLRPRSVHVAAWAYDLTRDELRYILDPTDVYGPDFPGETFHMLKEKEQAKFGEYRTRRRLLQARGGCGGGAGNAAVEREPALSGGRFLLQISLAYLARKACNPLVFKCFSFAKTRKSVKLYYIYG